MNERMTGLLLNGLRKISGFPEPCLSLAGDVLFRLLALWLIGVPVVPAQFRFDVGLGVSGLDQR